MVLVWPEFVTRQTNLPSALTNTQFDETKPLTKFRLYQKEMNVLYYQERNE